MSRRRPQGARYRWSIAARAVAALFGGYALAALSVATFALLSSAPRAEAVAAATLPSFALHLTAAVWAFWASTATRSWLGIGAPAAALAILVWFLRSPSAA